MVQLQRIHVLFYLIHVLGMPEPHPADAGLQQQAQPDVVQPVDVEPGLGQSRTQLHGLLVPADDVPPAAQRQSAVFHVLQVAEQGIADRVDPSFPHMFRPGLPQPVARHRIVGGMLADQHLYRELDAVQDGGPSVHRHVIEDVAAEDFPDGVPEPAVILDAFIVNPADFGKGSHRGDHRILAPAAPLPAFGGRNAGGFAGRSAVRGRIHQGHGVRAGFLKHGDGLFPAESHILATSHSGGSGAPHHGTARPSAYSIAGRSKGSE